MAGVRPSGILYIYKARLGARAVLRQESLAVLGIAVGVALLFASQISNASLTHSVAQLDGRIVGQAQVQLAARGPEGVSEKILADIRRVQGVLAAFPILEQRLNAIGPAGERPLELIGADRAHVGPLSDVLSRGSTEATASRLSIALPRTLESELGTAHRQRVKLQIGARFIEVPVRPWPDQATTGNLIHGPVGLSPLAYLQRLVGARHKLSRIFVRYDAAHERQAHSELVAAAARFHLNLLPANFDSRLFAVAVSPESQSETLFSALSALVGFIFALNAVLMTVPARLVLIHDVRREGARRSDIVKLLLLDAMIVAVLACAVGLALGYFLSIAVFQRTPSYLAVAFPIGRNLMISWRSFGVAVAAGATAAIVGVFWPLREIIFRPLLAAPLSLRIRWRSWARVRLATGWGCLAGTTLTLIAAPTAALVGNIALVVALVALLPAEFTLYLRFCEWISIRLDGVGSALAIAELRAPPIRIRSLAITATAAVAVFGIVEFQGIQANLIAGLDRSSHDLDSAADVWVEPTGKPNVQATTAFEGRDAAALRRVPGVAQVTVFRGSFFNWGDRRLWVLAPAGKVVRAVPDSQVIDGDASVASSRLREGGWVVLSRALAEEHHLRVGESFRLPSPRPLTLRVAALTTNLGWPPGALILNSATYARAWASRAPTAYAIQAASGVSPEVVRGRIRQVLRSKPGLAVETAGERDQRRYAIAAQGLSRLAQIRLLVLVAAILAVTGAMAAMIWQRRAWIAFIKVQGYDEMTLVRWLLCEAIVLLGAGCFTGAIFGVYGQLLGSRFLATVTGFPIVFSVQATATAKTFGLVTLVVLATCSVLACIAVRVPPNPGVTHTY